MPTSQSYILSPIPLQRTITPAAASTASTFSVNTDEVLFVEMQPASLHTLSISAVPAGKNQRPITIKRTDSNTNSTLRVQSTDGIDSALANRVSLGATTSLGIQSGESMTLFWEQSNSTWRVM